MNEVYLAVKMSEAFSSSKIELINDDSAIFSYVKNGFRVFKLSALPEVVRVETKIVDSSQEKNNEHD